MRPEDAADLRLAEALTNSLRKPEQSRLCARAVCIGLVLLKGGPLWEKHCRTRFQGFLNACLNFVTHSLTEDEIHRVDTALSTCRCNLNDPMIQSLHGQIGQIQQVYNFPRMVTSIFSTLCQVVSRTHPDTLRTSSKRKEKWPATPGHLLPRGPQEFLQCMVQWQKCTEGWCKTQTYPLFFTALALDANPSFANMALSYAPLQKHFFAQFHNLALAFEARAHPKFPTLEESLHHLIHLYNILLQNATGFSENIVAYDDAFRLYTDLGSLRTSLAAPDYEPYDEDEFEQATVLLVKLEHLTWSSLPGDKRPAREFPELSDLWESAFDPVNILFKHFETFRRQERCSGPECFKLAKQAAQLKRCVKCALMKYCSQACQRRHWNWEDGAHKTSCAEIGKIFKVFKEVDGKGKSPDVFKDRLLEEGFERDDLLNVLDPLEALQVACEELEEERAKRPKLSY